MIVQEELHGAGIRLKIPTIWQRIFEIYFKQSSQYKNQSFFVIRCEEYGKMVLCVGNCFSYYTSGPLVVALGLRRTNSLRTSSLWMSMKPISGVERELVFACLRWTTGEKIDQTLGIARYACQDTIYGNQQYVIAPFSSIVSTPQIHRANISILSFTTSLSLRLNQTFSSLQKNYKSSMHLIIREQWYGSVKNIFRYYFMGLCSALCRGQEDTILLIMESCN